MIKTTWRIIYINIYKLLHLVFKYLIDNYKIKMNYLYIVKRLI